MSIRWRLGALFFQIVLLGYGTWLTTGDVYSSSLWFLTGLLAVAVYPQLIEPFFPRAADILANTIICLVLFFIASKTFVRTGWNIFAIGLVISIILSLLAIFLGAGKEEGFFAHLGRVARIITKPLSARTLYSIVFWLALLDSYAGIQREVWILGCTWALIVIISRINWQNAWSTLEGAPTSAEIEGMIGPSRLIISSIFLPPLGTRISITCGNKNLEGILIGRIRRQNDVWGQLLMSSPEDCEEIRSKKNLELSVIDRETPESSLIGTVDVGSTEKILQFAPIKNLEIGKVVAVLMTSGEHVYYQITSAEISKITSKNDSHLIVRCIANQIGCFSQSTNRLAQHRWVPDPGVGVEEPGIITDSISEIPENYFKLGTVIGTRIPVFIDLKEVCEGHLAILGMTKMGKTSLAIKIAQNLANDHSVTVLDQTGEYKNRRGLLSYQNEQDLDVPNLRVHEPPSEEISAADFGYNFLQNIVVPKAKQEYSQGEPFGRILLIDEAHQFVHEPTGLGFGAPGRDSAYKFGITMMQIRKYKISIVLVSQRTAVVAKSALSQCENIIAFRNVDQTGLDYLEAIVGTGIRKLLPQLKQGEALVFGPALSTDGAVALTIEHNN